MQIDNSRHLRARCGSYGILLDISCVIEIINMGKMDRLIEKTGENHNSGFYSWNDQDIPYFDLHTALGINKQTSSPPQYAIVLTERSSKDPLVVISIDDIYEIMETQLTHWHEMTGINKQLDLLFDLAYPYENINEILFRLNPSQRWLKKNNGVDHAD